MNLTELTLFLIKGLTTEPDMVSVKEFDDDDEITIEVVVSEKDMGAVIGKAGVTANAIRTLVQATAYVNNLPRVKVNIDSI